VICGFYRSQIRDEWIGKNGMPACKPIDPEILKEKKNWPVIKTQFAAFAAAKA
jgi:hypothetical protein